MKPHIFHVRSRDQLDSRLMISDGDVVMKAHVDETEEMLKARWVSILGEPRGGFVRVPGLVRMEEFAALLEGNLAPAATARGGAA